MRNLGIVSLVVMLGAGFGCQKSPPPPKPDVLVEWHFVGREGVYATTNGAHLKTILALPQSTTLLDQTLDKLARAPFARFQQRLPGQTNDCADRLRPLLEDLTRAESYFQMRGLSNQTPEWTLAVRLSAERANVWRTDLAGTLATWFNIQPTNFASAAQTGWRLQKHETPNLIGLMVAGEWVLFGAGQDQLSLQTELVERVKAQGRPVDASTNYWLQAMVDWPRLEAQPRWLAALRLPKTDLTVVGQGEFLQTKVELAFPEPHLWKHEPWQFPTNIIREPVVSFTAFQGFAARLKPFAQALGLDAAGVPNQACTWALAEIPFQTYVAAPFADATNVMAQLCEQLPPRFMTNTQGLALGSWRAATNNLGLAWADMPFFGGFLRLAYEETNGGFIFAGLFPNTPKLIPPPPELFYQVLGRTNLAYYDWEIGAERLPAWRNMAQLALLLAEKPQLDPQSAAFKWTEAASTNLGNIGTSLTVTGPDHMTLARQSPYGFTGLETVLLANWLESVTFPWGYELPAPPMTKHSGEAATPKP